MADMATISIDDVLAAPIGYRADGRPIWPIAGGDGSGDGGDGGGDGGSGDGGAAGGDGGAGSGDGGDGSDGGTVKDAAYWEKEATKWKGLSRQHETRAKANADAAKRLKEAEDADKSEVQKATEAAATEKKARDDAEARALRAEVALDKGLTRSMAKRLVGTTKEELEADADELLKELKPDTGGNGTGRPKEALRSGASSGDGGKEVTGADIVKSIPRGV